MAALPLTDRAGLAPAQLAALRLLVARQRSLGDLLDWCRGRGLLARWPEVVTQDEYTHDVIVPWGDGLFLVYDAT